jgi:phosphoribosyl 1,2-cyclic phosphate phosphodiesterase
MMNLLFLGTGAAEGIPAAYCRCRACTDVRERGGIEIKTRSALRLGKKYQVDISPDNHYQMIKHKIDMYEVEHIFVTHLHGDHFGWRRLSDRFMSEVTNDNPLNICLSLPAKRHLESLLEESLKPSSERKQFEEQFTVTGLEYFEEYRIDELKVETIKGNHDGHGENERSMHYLFTLPEGKKLLYALDTGYYLEDTWEYLAGKHADILVMECTFAGRTDRGQFPDGHLDLPSFLKTLERMKKNGFIDEQTRVYSTHLNPHQGLTHHELQKRFDDSPFNVTVAYDGLEVGV